MLVLLAVLWPAAAQKVSIEYGTIPKTEIERRLREVQDSNLKREQKLLQLFGEAGCGGDRLTEQPVKHEKVPNVICTLPGATASLIIVGAHSDFVDRGKGVVDNWSGSSLLPSLFQSLNTIPRRHTFLFIGFTREEGGLIGSRFYVQQLSKDELKKISGMVNIDSVGTGPTKLETDRGSKLLADALAQTSFGFKLPLQIVNVHAVGRSDSDSFQDRKVPALNIHSLTSETFPILHTPRDQMSAIRLDDYYDTYLLVRAYLAYLDQVLDAGT